MVTSVSSTAFASRLFSETSSFPFLRVGDGPMGHVVDLALGGGRCCAWLASLRRTFSDASSFLRLSVFYPNSSSSSCRTDGSDLFASADLKGTNVLLSRKEYDSALSASNGVLPLPLIGLFNQVSERRPLLRIASLSDHAHLFTRHRIT